MRKPKALSPEDMCLEDYKMSVINPFNMNLAPCLPTFPSVPSERLTTFARGSLTTGTSLFGFVACNLSPVTSLVDGSANVNYSAATGYVTNTIGVTPTAGIGDIGSNSPYTTVTAGVNEWRLVSCGLRVRYSGPETTRGGSILCYRHIQNDTLVGQSFSTLQSNDKAHSEPVDDKWHQILYLPVKPSDFEFQDTANSTVYPMAIMISGASGLTFDWEVVWHHEIIGTGARGKVTSHSQPMKMQSFLSKVTDYSPATLNDMKQYGSYAASAVIGGYAAAGGRYAAPLMMTQRLLGY